MMWYLTLLMVSACWAAKLDQIYLPPSGAASAGGFPGDIVAPLPGAPNPPIPIVSYSNQPNAGDGSYSFSYETGNGIKAQEAGVLKNEVPEGPGEAVHGIYSYTGPDGVVYTVAYTADENGFVAKGDHLPTPPPIPAEILASLQQSAAEEATAQPAPPAPAQVGYFKAYPNVYHNRQYSNKYFHRY